MKKVSVVVPCYNASYYLDKCIRKLTEQTIGLADMEIILVDDASTDEGATLDIIMKYEQKFPDTIVAVPLSENLRQGGARNVGISYAAGEYLMFCDADDWLMAETLEHLYEAAKKYDADVVECRIKDIRDYHMEISAIERGNESCLIALDTEEQRKEFLLKVNDKLSLGSQKKLYRLSMLRENQIRFVEHRIFEEPSFMVPVRLYEKRHYFLDEALYICFLSPESSMRGNWGEHKWDNPYVWQHLINDLERRGLLKRYYPELEFMFISWGFGLSIRMVLQKGYVLERQELQSLIDMLLKMFPNVTKNKYLQERKSTWSSLIATLPAMEITEKSVKVVNEILNKYIKSRGKKSEEDATANQKQHLKQQVDRLLQTGRHDEIKPFLLANKETTEHDNELTTVCYLCTIYEQEKKAGQRTIFEKTGSMLKLLERYTALKFYLRRVDFDVMDDMGLFYSFLSQEQVSSYELLRAVDFCVVHKDKVLQRIGADGEEEAEPAVMAGEAADYKAAVTAEENNAEQICFILCTNDPVYAQECIYYINHLIVPDGHCVDVLTVEDARSMTSGYNEAMRYSKAKYKVYLHHDTFIVNPYFLQNLIQIFQSDEEIGMIGVIGAPRIPENGIMWDAKRYGMIYEQHIYETVMLSNACRHPLEEVEAVDGLLMATQYDIEWREDLFSKWDFYDCSQSMEFIRRGYKVVVPKTEKPWCVHDCGFLNLENYDEERQKFVVEYLTG